MNPHVITVANRKGGDGKTITAYTLAHMYHSIGKRVLMIDMDSQCNLTLVCGVKPQQTMKDDPMREPTIYDALTGNSTIGFSTEEIEDGMRISRGSLMMSVCDRMFTDLDAPYKLKECIERIKRKPDVIIIDTAPSMDISSVMALTASNSVVIPAQADRESLQGVSMITDTIRKVQNRTNSELTIAGVLLTRYNGRQTYTKQMEQSIRDFAKVAGIHVFSTPIRECVAVKESAVMHQPITTYAPKSTASQDYKAFFEELQERTQTDD